MITTTDTAPTPAPGGEAISHLPSVLLGLRWLYDTEQPTNAIARSDGQALPSTGGQTLRFIPREHPGGTVIRIETTLTTADPYPVAGKDLDNFAGLLDDLDVHVHRRWIEYPGASACFALFPPAHPSLCAAVARYERGCAVHRDRDLCACTEYVEGRAALIGIAQLHRQARTAAAAIPTLVGRWPLHLDPSGELSQAALRQCRPLSLSDRAISRTNTLNIHG